MTAVLIISVSTCLIMVASIIFFPKFRLFGVEIGTYWVVALIGALTLIVCGLLGFDEAIGGLVSAESEINPLKIITLFLSLTALSTFLDEVGFFRYLAFIALKRAKTSRIRLFFNLYIIISIFTVFTANDIIILTFTPFICYFCKNAKMNPVPFLFAEFVAANVWSMLFIIGNPTNIYIATASGITFLEYLAVMALPTLLGGLVSAAMLFVVFRRRLEGSIDTSALEEVKIADRGLLIIGLVHLSVCTVLLAISAYINLEMWLLTLAFAVSLIVSTLVYKAVKKQPPKELGAAVKRLPFELVPFVISMFVIIIALEKYKVTEAVAAALGGNGVIFTFGTTAFFLANLVNNIPMSVFFEAVARNLSGAAQTQAVFAAIIGSNVCAILTPVGALAGIMWASILKKQGVKFSFLDFVKHGAAVALPTLAAALAGLWIVLG